MHPGPKMVLSAALLLAASVCLAQELYHAPDLDLMARLSYDNSGAVANANVRRMCIAVFRDGEYRIMRSARYGMMERLHGKMPKEELDQLSKLLEAADFRKLSGYHGGLVRQEAETFAAEIPAADRSHADQKWPQPEAWRLQWLNGDRQNPFPPSVLKVVDWLEDFQPKDGKNFEYSDYPDVCPGGGLRFLQPSVADNSHP